MKLEQLIPILETEERWKETDCFQGMLAQGKTEWAEGLLNNLKEIIPSKIYSPKVKLGATRLLKLCLEAGSEYFNEKVQEGTFLEELTKYANPNIQRSYNNVNEESTIYFYIVEGFLFWSTWFPRTKFEYVFKYLKTNGVLFPEISELLIFKAENLRLYINGEFQRKQGKEQDRNLGQQQSMLDQNQKEVGPQISAVHQDQYLSAGTKVVQLIQEYDQKKDQMFGMLEDLKSAGELDQFVVPFKQFVTEADGSLLQHQSIREQQINTLIEKGDQCVEICSIFKSFSRQNITFPNMKKQLQDIQKKQMAQSAILEDQQHQKSSIISGQSEILNESQRRLPQNILCTKSLLQSSRQLQNKLQDQNSFAFFQRPEMLQSRIPWENDSRLNDNDVLYDILADLGNVKDNQQVQTFSQTNSAILNNFCNDLRCFEEPKPKPVEFLMSQPENQNQNEISQNQNSIGNNYLIQSQQQAECVKLVNRQPNQPNDRQHKDNQYSLGEMSQNRSYTGYAGTTQDSSFGGKRDNQNNQLSREKLFQQNQEQKIIIEQQTQTIQELLQRIAQLELNQTDKTKKE